MKSVLATVIVAKRLEHEPCQLEDFLLPDDHPMVVEDMNKWSTKTYAARRKY